MNVGAGSTWESVAASHEESAELLLQHSRFLFGVFFQKSFYYLRGMMLQGVSDGGHVSVWCKFHGGDNYLFMRNLLVPDIKFWAYLPPFFSWLHPVEDYCCLIPFCFVAWVATR